MHEDDCPLCAATKRVFGDRFSGCAGISNDLSVAATTLIKERIGALLMELETKRAAGLVSDEDYVLMQKSIRHSFSFAASNVPSVALVSGADSDPPTMMQLVQANMVSMIRSVFQRRVEQEGPSALIELLMMLREVGSGSGDDPNTN